eukprot:g8920.t1
MSINLKMNGTMPLKREILWKTFVRWMLRRQPKLKETEQTAPAQQAQSACQQMSAPSVPDERSLPGTPLSAALSTEARKLLEELGEEAGQEPEEEAEENKSKESAGKDAEDPKVEKSKSESEEKKSQEVKTSKEAKAAADATAAAAKVPQAAAETALSVLALQDGEAQDPEPTQKAAPAPASMSASKEVQESKGEKVGQETEANQAKAAGKVEEPVAEPVQTSEEEAKAAAAAASILADPEAEKSQNQTKAQESKTSPRVLGGNDARKAEVVKDLVATALEAEKPETTLASVERTDAAMASESNPDLARMVSNAMIERCREANVNMVGSSGNVPEEWGKLRKHRFILHFPLEVGPHRCFESGFVARW